MAKESSQHKGHRQRMRARVEQYGLESLEPHEALEYVLYITNTRKDTNGLAHVLMDRFGDFAGVLDASEEDLLTVEGVGPSTARMLHLLPQVGRYYTQCAVNGKKCMKTTDQLVEYLMAQFAGTVQERALLAALDGRSRIKGLFWLRDGTSDRVSLEIKDVVAAALKGGTDSVVLCHNHPQRCGSALAGGSDGHREYRPGTGAGQGASAGSHHPDRERIFLHAGGQPPAVLRFPDRGDAQAVLIL